MSNPATPEAALILAQVLYEKNEHAKATETLQERDRGVVLSALVEEGRLLLCDGSVARTVPGSPLDVSDRFVDPPK